jgi:hypothetical protein
VISKMRAAISGLSICLACATYVEASPAARKPTAYVCREGPRSKKPPYTVEVVCTPNCEQEPKILDVKSLMKFGITEREAEDASQQFSEMAKSWHRTCDHPKTT